MSEYSDIVLNARNLTIQDLAPSLRLRLMRRLVEELDAVNLRLGTGEISAAQARVFKQDILRALTRYVEDAQGIVRASSLRSIENAVEAHTRGLAALSQAHGVSLSASFAGVPTQAYEAMFIRRQLGFTFETLTRRNAREHAFIIERALDRMVLQGESYTTATRSIMKTLALSDPYMREVAENYGARGGLTHAARAAGVPFNAEASRVARTLGYDAKRIAITETNVAYHEGDRLSSMRSPVVKGMKWNLSARHPKEDVCDILAGADVYGIGEGVYPPAYIPTIPHPFCLCYRTAVLRPIREWSIPKRTYNRPAPDRDAIARMVPNVTERAREKAVSQYLDLLYSAYDDERMRRAA